MRRRGIEICPVYRHAETCLLGLMFHLVSDFRLYIVCFISDTRSCALSRSLCTAKSHDSSICTVDDSIQYL